MMSTTALTIAFAAVAFVADGVIFLLLWEWARAEREREIVTDLTKKGN